MKAQAAGLADSGFIMERRLPIRQVQDNPVYAGLVETMDEAIGNVLAALEKEGLGKNTIVIFTSDHGGVSSGDNFSTSNLPLRGGKGYQWEGGLRVPYFIKVPGMEKTRSIDYPASGTDFYATILDLIGAEQMPREHLESLSLLPAMKGEKMSERSLFWHYPHYSNQGGDPFSSIRKGDWKLIYYWEDNSSELYNLRKDPFEQENLASSQKEKSLELEKELIQWLIETKANQPIKDPEYRVDLEKEYLERMSTEVWSNLENQRIEMLQPSWQPNNDWWGSKLTGD
jgi:arylsulfatase A-like enzyme